MLAVTKREPRGGGGRTLRKHGAEIARMAAPEHLELIPLVEVALAVMRLSCERFFVLASVLAAYLLFGERVPRAASALIRLNHRVSTAFQRVRALASPAGHSLASALRSYVRRHPASL